MKTTYVLYTVFAVALMLLAACSTLDNKVTQDNFKINFPAGSSSGHADFELAVSFPLVPEKLKVYSIKSPNITTESVMTLGAKLGFTGKAGIAEPGIVTMSDINTGAVLKVYVDSGAIEYSYTSPLKLFPKGTPTLPANEDAKQRALSFLTERGLLPTDIYPKEVVEGGSHNGIISHLLVRFGREIEGIPTTGPGSKFAVRIGDKGEIIQMFLLHREVEPYTDVSVKRPTQAYEDFLAGDGCFAVPLECKTVKIKEIGLAYWMDAAPEIQELVSPVLEFKGECLNQAGEYLEEFTGWVEIVAK